MIHDASPIRENDRPSRGNAEGNAFIEMVQNCLYSSDDADPLEASSGGRPWGSEVREGKPKISVQKTPGADGSGKNLE
jgi:hypothetical protein